MADDAKDYFYVGRARERGCATSVVVDDPKHPEDTANSVQEMMASGSVIERMLGDDFRAMAARGEFMRCKHKAA